MQGRLKDFNAHMDLIKPLIDYGTTVKEMGLEPKLVGLVLLRASQINGCAVCLHLHATEARRLGETEDRILMVAAAEECPLYTDREKAALAWTDTLTRLTETHAPDAAYEALQAQFSETDQVKLTLLIGMINAFNRLGVGFRQPPVSLHQQQAA